MSEPHFQKSYQRLNNAQKKAVDTIEGPVLVVAGPGSGKTEILSLRVANILQKKDVYASNILCLTFTDSASVNMRKRLAKIIESEAYHVNIHTFHNFCVDVIQRYPEYFYDGALFEPADEVVQREVLEEIFQQMSHDNPIQSTHPDHGFVYLDHAKDAIGYIKSGGLTPDEFHSVLDHNKHIIDSVEERIDAIFSKRVSQGLLDEIDSFIDELTQIDTNKMPVPHLRPLHEVLALSLEESLTQAENEESTKPITAWKQDHTLKSDGKRILKAADYQNKLYSLADVYEQYSTLMYERGYYDFDDMLLDVIQEVENNKTLKAQLQEQYQYIHVDEFQDTNDAQMRLLLLLADTPLESNQPNVMAVGDDDQAIYKFQGAEISNILNFKHRFSDTEVITMTDNYRSTQDILDSARSVITQGKERLEEMMDDMQKDLSAALHEETGTVEEHVYPTATHQYHGIAKQIRAQIDDGADPSEIAVIGRRHTDLKSLVPYLQESNIPITYERQQNVFEEPHIHQLVVMAKFVHSLGQKDKETADEYLPEILSFPFWELDRRIVWKISLASDKEQKRWLEVMLEHTNQQINQIAEFFLECGQRARNEPVEYILDTLVGAHIETSKHDTNKNIPPSRTQTDDDFVSPFKEFYFSKEQFEEHKSEYLRFLSSLKTFISAVREYRRGSMLKLADLIDFIETHENNDLPVKDTSPFVNADDAVELMTAHKAKGREFERVYVISSQERIWAGRSYGSYLPLPLNMPFAPPGNTTDDQLRLFYVAMTRAKKQLYLNRFQFEDDGGEALPVQFLTEIDVPQEEYTRDDMPSVSALLETTVPNTHTPPFVKEEKALLSPLVEDYQLSVTHLTNFLDVTEGGPQHFLQQNLLRFPQPMPVAARYGSVIHKTLKQVYLSLKDTNRRPPVESVIDWFRTELSKQRLSERDKKHFQKRGGDALQLFYEHKKDTFAQDHFAEFNFRQEGVRVEGADITGKIDKMVPNEKTMQVHDFKTGSVLKEWNDRVKKSWRYKNQLIFYKLLVDNSKTFGDEYTVDTGVLEFVEPQDGTLHELSLSITAAQTKRMKSLINIVYDHITDLSFPAVDQYEESIDGIRAFADDLIKEAK